MDQDRRVHFLFFAVSFLVLAVGAFWGLPSGKSVAGALVILDGGVPYRDFWTMYAPGQFYAVAALYGLFGRELLVQAVAVCLVRAATALALVGLLRRLGAARGTAYALATVFVFMSWKTAPELTDYPLALPFLLLALDRAAGYFRNGGIADLRWAGLWLGLAACFKHDVSAYIAIGITTSIVLANSRFGGLHSPGRESASRAVATLLGVAVAVVAPLVIWTAWTAAAAAWNDLFVFPATVFSKVRGDAFPPLVPDVKPLFAWLADVTHVGRALRAADPLSTWVILYAPVVIFLSGVSVLVRRRWQPDAISRAQLALFLAPMPFFWFAAHVQQNTHPYTLAILGAAAGVVIWRAAVGGIAWRARVHVPLMAALSIYALGLVTEAAIHAARVYYEWPGSQVMQLAGFRGVRLPARLFNSFDPTGRFIRAAVPAGEPIYTGLLRHDSIVVNNALLYAIAGRPACCGYTELHPGVGDRAPVHREIIRRLEQSNVRAMVLWQFGWPAEIMEARKRHTVAGVPDAGSTILDRYIADHFEPLAQYGEYHILWRRDAAAPVSGPFSNQP
jgi:hypothetical protein